ncbi:MAG: type II toxin-antitoxin system VapC family toxin [Paracoccaceae bacterium]
MNGELLLDTCAIIWSAGESGPVNQLKEIINPAFARGETIWTSPISAWELGNLARKGAHTAIRPPLRWYEETCARAGLKEVVLSARILVGSTELPGDIHGDPADRILIATAREMGLRIVTRDRAIIDYAKRGHVLAVAC